MELCGKAERVGGGLAETGKPTIMDRHGLQALLIAS